MKCIASIASFSTPLFVMLLANNNDVTAMEKSEALYQKLKSEYNAGFSASGTVDLDNALENNLQIIGAHLHTGSMTVNGPVDIIFCGGPPLPGVLGINGECDDLSDQALKANGMMNTAHWEATTSKGAWEDGANKATSVDGAKSLADGAATTYDTFMEALDECTGEADSCDVYFNIHTNYSVAYNEGAYGLARGQLVPTDCPSDKPDGAKCWTATVTSDNTNMVDGIPNQLPANAGMVGDLLVTYTGGDMDDHDHDDKKDDTDMSAAAFVVPGFPTTAAAMAVLSAILAVFVGN